MTFRFLHEFRFTCLFKYSDLALKCVDPVAFTVELPKIRQHKNATVTCLVTGADLCLIELGVGTTLLIPSALSGKHIVQRGHIIGPRTNECLGAVWLLKITPFLTVNRTQIPEETGKETRNILWLFSDFSGEAKQLKDFLLPLR